MNAYFEVMMSHTVFVVMGFLVPEIQVFVMGHASPKLCYIKS